ncbi:hypothetical protein [Caldivirga sp.]|uniref:hypothetical protein n=1 Tax=Caldivirga sp. TaxID=2080243 RepID=UPI0025BF895B|nr:hypothetical protein [Caldivirga sp.]
MSIRSIVSVGKVMKMSERAINDNVNHKDAVELGTHEVEGELIKAFIVPGFNAPIVFIYDERDKAYKIP